MGIEFTAIDFETANGFRGSPCSVGLTKVRDGQVVEEASWLMRPPEGFDHFDPRNVQIHGITADMVAGSPRFGEIFPEMAGFIGADVLVAHNAAFDMGVIRSALEVSELSGPAYDYACTVILSRRSYSLVSYSLPFVAEAAGVPLLNHHDAVADARACAGIMVDIAARNSAASIAELLVSMQLPASRLQEYVPGRDGLSKPTVNARTRQELAGAAGGAAPSTAWTYWPQEGSNPPANPEADETHPLFGQTIVFTGNLGIERQQAKIRAAALGAQPASTVTRKTSVLVVGDGFVAADLKRGRITTKAQKVLALHGRGQQVEVLSEGEFLQMLGGEWPSTSA
ncbi:exonuclease domain-containing protein [Arthrobacter sp. VKM Ac-2550]|uniref:exonuclease domain-containing protein n=1 Tax=Crystallibacter permensis TaxID=1938888 RepID=UPI00222684D8|nr:exonuclease domain-containing protein [Arthrobacter sp. VKM Ac-2550]